MGKSLSRMTMLVGKSFLREGFPGCFPYKVFQGWMREGVPLKKTPSAFS
jgi:hypothetical protein